MPMFLSVYKCEYALIHIGHWCSICTCTRIIHVLVWKHPLLGRNDVPNAFLFLVLVQTLLYRTMRWTRNNRWMISYFHIICEYNYTSIRLLYLELRKWESEPESELTMLKKKKRSSSLELITWLVWKFVSQVRYGDTIQYGVVHSTKWVRIGVTSVVLC